MKFLGITGYNSAWIDNYTKITGPLRAMIKEAGSGELHCNLTWTQEGRLAFETIKQRLQEAPALALPDYSKNFVLRVSSSPEGKYACAVLAQPTGTGTSLLNHGKFALTMPRIWDYHRLLEQEDVTFARSNTINPADMLPTPEDGEPHDCVIEAERYSKLRSDLQAALPLQEPDVEYWTDGSCYRIGGDLTAGYAIVKFEGPDFVTVTAEAIPQPCSEQLAELTALIKACSLAEGKRVNIYTDSIYAYSVCHLFAAVRKDSIMIYTAL